MEETRGWDKFLRKYKIYQEYISEFSLEELENEAWINIPITHQVFGHEVEKYLPRLKKELNL